MAGGVLGGIMVRVEPGEVEESFVEVFVPGGINGDGVGGGDRTKTTDGRNYGITDGRSETDRQ